VIIIKKGNTNLVEKVGLLLLAKPNVFKVIRNNINRIDGKHQMFILCHQKFLKFKLR